MHTRLFSPDAEGLAAVSALLTAGEVVAIPTETVYGLAGDARNPDAVARIYAAKGRPSFNPLIVHLPDLNAARRIAVFDAGSLALAAAFWPGALTMVLPLRPDAGIASLVTAGLDTVAIRLPALPAARELLRVFGGPLAAPSANPSGRISPTAAAHVADPETGLGGRIPAVLDAGACPVGVESTIVGWVDGQPALLRPGGVAAEDIQAVLGRSLILPQINPDAPTAPGQLTSHYAPRASLRLNATDAAPHEVLIGFGAVAGHCSLSESGDPVEAAARLFDILHRADALGRPIAVAPIPEAGLGAAINDRLRRAAAPR